MTNTPIEVNEFIEDLKRVGLDPLKVAKLEDLLHLQIPPQCGSGGDSATSGGFIKSDLALLSPLEVTLDLFNPKDHYKIKWYVTITDTVQPENNRSSEVIVTHDGGPSIPVVNVYYTESNIIYNGLINNFLLSINLVGSGVDKQISLIVTADGNIRAQILRLNMD